jgi:hypothetical protein
VTAKVDHNNSNYNAGTLVERIVDDPLICCHTFSVLHPTYALCPILA